VTCSTSETFPPVYFVPTPLLHLEISSSSVLFVFDNLLDQVVEGLHCGVAQYSLQSWYNCVVTCNLSVPPLSPVLVMRTVVSA
jgi:hypothetical protein